MVILLLARNEHFGKTLYDSVTAEYFFISDQDFELIKLDNNINLIDNQLLYDTANILYAPLKCYFDITFACNLNCKTCLNMSGKKSDDELSHEDAISVVGGIKSDSIFEIKFSGGEPTLRKGWDEIFQYAKDLGIAFSVNTNGIYTAKTLEKMIELNPREIDVSLDGFKELNDYIRGRGNFEKAISSIKIMSEAGCNVSINTIVTNGMSEKEIDSLLSFAAEYCGDISFFHPRPLGRAKKNFHLIPDFHELNIIMNKIDRLKSNYDTFKIKTRSENSRRGALASSSVANIKLLSGGNQGFTTFNIMPDGSLYSGGCLPYVSKQVSSTLRLGNIVDEEYSILNVWHNSEKLSELRKTSHILQNQCENCSSYISECSGFSLEMEFMRQEHGHNRFCKYGG